MASTNTCSFLNQSYDFTHESYSVLESSPQSSSENDLLSLPSNSPVYAEVPADIMDLLSSANIDDNSELLGPFLTIEEELKTTLRFRYKSEKGQHGGLKPIVKLNNYEGNPHDVYIKASLFTSDERPHLLQLGGKQCKDGICWQKLSSDYIAKFPSLSIYKKKKEEIAAILKDRKKADLKQSRRKIDESIIEKEVKEEFKSVNSTSAKLCFEAFIQKQVPICDKVFSETIFNQKNPFTGNLKITRLSSYSGKCSGGDELILLCEKIRKEDIEIHIYECVGEDNITWQAKCDFKAADVHHQVAIPFKTPPYKENQEATVYIRLYRKSDGKFGEGRKFLYIPSDIPDDAPACKRKRPNPTEDFSSTPSSTNFDIEMPNNYGTSNSPSKDPSTTQAMLYEHDDMSNSVPTDVLSSELTSDWAFYNNFGIPLEKFVNDILNGDRVNTDAAISDLASLNLSTEGEMKTPNLKTRIPKLSDEEQINKLKECLIYLIRSREKSSFMQFLPILMKITDEHRNSLLHLSIKEKSNDLLMLIRLLQVAPNDLKNGINKFHQTPLHLAISKRLWKVVRILLLFGADSNIKDKDGNNCVHLAVKYNLPRCLTEILSPSTYEKYQKCTPCIDALNHEGFAPLHISVMNESKACVELLIKAKADINITDGKSGKTPLHLAYEKGSKLVEYFLSQPGICKTALDYSGNAPNSKEGTSFHCKISPTPSGSDMKPEYVDNAMEQKENTSTPDKVNLYETTESTECCIYISSENSSDEDSSSSVSEAEKEVSLKVKTIDSEIEKKLCEILDSSEQWRMLGAYIMDNNELNIIADIDSAPTKTILNQLKKRHGNKYSEELLYILKGTEFQEVTKMLNSKI